MDPLNGVQTPVCAAEQWPASIEHRLVCQFPIEATALSGSLTDDISRG